MKNDHLVLAKKFLAIAESGDSKREAYKRAAKEIVAALDEGMSKRAVATTLGKNESFVRQIVKWHESGYQANTPWLADTEATKRAALSHTRATLQDAPAEQVVDLVGKALAREDVIEHLSSQPKQAERTLFKPTNEVLNRNARRKGIDFDKDHKVKPTSATRFDEMKAKAQIVAYLSQATDLAIEHNLVEFFVEFLDDARDKVEMSLLGSNPKQAVADLEAWLRDQGGAPA